MDKLWYDAVALAADGGGVLTPERELKLAYDALTSAETVQDRVEKCERPYSGRQKRLVGQDSRRDDYLMKTAKEPLPPTHKASRF